MQLTYPAINQFCQRVMSASLLIWFTEINNTVQHTMYTKNTGKDICSLRGKKVLHSIIFPPPSFFVSAVNSDNCTITWKLRLMNGHKDIQFVNYLHDWCAITLSRRVTVWKPDNAYSLPLALIFPKLLTGMIQSNGSWSQKRVSRVDKQISICTT